MESRQRKLTEKFHSKRDLYDYMLLKLQLWLPQFNSVRLEFLQQILQDEKRALRADEVKNVNVNLYWSELAPKNIFINIKNDELLLSFLPTDQIQKGKFTDRIFFWGICQTIRSRWTQDIIKRIEKSRQSLVNKLMQPKTITIRDHWAKLLEEHDFISKNKKRGSKSIMIAHKPNIQIQRKRIKREPILIQSNDNDSQIVERQQQLFGNQNSNNSIQNFTKFQINNVQNSQSQIFSNIQQNIDDDLQNENLENNTSLVQIEEKLYEQQLSKEDQMNQVLFGNQVASSIFLNNNYEDNLNADDGLKKLIGGSKRSFDEMNQENNNNLQLQESPSTDKVNDESNIKQPAELISLNRRFENQTLKSMSNKSDMMKSGKKYKSKRQGKLKQQPDLNRNDMKNHSNDYQIIQQENDQLEDY